MTRVVQRPVAKMELMVSPPQIVTTWQLQLHVACPTGTLPGDVMLAEQVVRFLFQQGVLRQVSVFFRNTASVVYSW